MGSAVMDLLTSDAAILLFSCIGLAVTTLSILRDTRSQRAAVAVPDNVHQLVTEDVRAEAA